MNSSIKAYAFSKIIKAAAKKPALFVAETEEGAKKFLQDLEFFLPDRLKGYLRLFPEPDAVPYSHLTTQTDIWTERLKILRGLVIGEPFIVIASIDSVIRRCPPPKIFKSHSITLRLHDKIDLSDLTKFLCEAGYLNMPLVEDEGTFCVRGGILDIFSPAMERPVRCELEGDEIIALRTFEPATQRSSFGVNSFDIIPSRSVILSKENIETALGKLKPLCDDLEIKPYERRDFASAIENGIYPQSTETLMPLFYDKTSLITDYLPADSVRATEDTINLEEQGEKFLERVLSTREESKKLEKIITPELLFETEIKAFLAKFEEVKSPPYTLPNSSVILSEMKDPPGDSSVASALRMTKRVLELSLRTVVTCHTQTQAERVLDILRWHKIPCDILEGSFADTFSARKTSAQIMFGRLSSGLVLEQEGLAIIRDEDIFGTKIAKRSYESNPADAFNDLSQLQDGDYIIHKDHGIGRYIGLKNLNIGGINNDFLELHYLGSDKLYLPVLKINLISRYIGAGAAEGSVALDKLGGTRWSKAQEKVNSSIRTMAMELLRIYAQRKIGEGFAFSGRDELLEEFEASFPYDETPDQWRAIEEVLGNMASTGSTDRLICGDVGYGKTEVAMRAAFKAVTDKKQVAILVPTTVLAFQHYENFSSRFSKWPAKVDMLSRFKTRSEQNTTIAGLANGTVDIVIGTHRLLQKDIRFSDLGLLIIDEEHRFGVSHKERIRKLRANVDTIAMSATPIPRTLELSLSGIRDISVINTPPASRLSIRTYISEFNEEIIKGAIKAEVSRGGQVFFVHNRVETIDKFHDTLKRLLPDVRIVVGHGQMDESELEDVMITFLEKKADVLLCTTIIESGLDVPSANTIIINRADAMGLAQLYQLRGRVGRSNIQAFAYLMTPAEESISKIARKRLALLQRYTELGSGFQIAMHDLEIRGAGNILGAEQSGHINAIGYELYNELLEKTVRRLKGEPDDVKVDVEVNLPLPAFIPEDYVADQGQRLILYRRLAAVADTDGLDELAREMEDRFGKPPKPAQNLLGVVDARLSAKTLMIENISYDGDSFALKFHPLTTVNPESILKRIKKEPAKYGFRGNTTLTVKGKNLTGTELLRELKSLLRGLGVDS